MYLVTPSTGFGDLKSYASPFTFVPSRKKNVVTIRLKDGADA
jgi:hypothetical protein